VLLVPVLFALDDVRDVTIIVVGVLMVLLLLALLAFTLAIGIATRTVLGSVQSLLKGDVRPLLSDARATVTRVRGTATFVSETTAKPIIRGYAMFAGTRRAFAVLTGFTAKRKNQDDDAPEP
jgi:hypothetical protein